MSSPLPPTWELSATSFNWTPEIGRARVPAAEIMLRIVTDVSAVIEIEPGQLWRSFPAPSLQEVSAFRAAVAAAGGRVSMTGASLDTGLPGGRRRTPEDRARFLALQLRTAADAGAGGLRLPLGALAEGLEAETVALLHELDLTLFYELQGSQRPDADPWRGLIDRIAQLDDDRIRLLIDTSMLMPALPVTFLEHLRRKRVDPAMVDRLASAWGDPQTAQSIREHLDAGLVPPDAAGSFRSLLGRFGWSRAHDLAPVMPLVGAFHLKFWDLEDEDARVSAPLREVGRLLARTGFAGTLASEWGGHDWLEAIDASEITRSHLSLAAAQLALGRADATGRGDGDG